jgi:hypothetical protein
MLLSRCCCTVFGGGAETGVAFDATARFFVVSVALSSVEATEEMGSR